MSLRNELKRLTGARQTDLQVTRIETEFYRLGAGQLAVILSIVLGFSYSQLKQTAEWSLQNTSCLALKLPEILSHVLSADKQQWTWSLPVESDKPLVLLSGKGVKCRLLGKKKKKKKKTASNTQISVVKRLKSLHPLLRPLRSLVIHSAHVDTVGFIFYKSVRMFYVLLLIDKKNKVLFL